MAKDLLYGSTNKIMAEITSHLLKHPELNKFLYYTDAEYEIKNILEEDIPPSSEIYDKNFAVYKRVPEVITESGAYMFINIYRIIPTTVGGKINGITINVDILVHEDCLRTIHGNRVICLCTALDEAMHDYTKKHTIGSANQIRILPLLGIVKDFEGYTIQYELHGFNR